MRLIDITYHFSCIIKNKFGLFLTYFNIVLTHFRVNPPPLPHTIDIVFEMITLSFDEHTGIQDIGYI